MAFVNCWEYKNCGRNKDGGCPAYPKRGMECWRISGTMCGGVVQGTFAQKLASCMECDYYKKTKGIAS
ncbi:MAG: hypothetical protein K6T91_06590 [Firmicutes bacterium]|nr:hypothetical protein [Bacillota bacterium]